MKKNQKIVAYLIFVTFSLCLFYACDECAYIADFDYAKADNSATSIAVGDEISFYPDDKLALNYTWDFGQGHFSNQQNPTHIFWSAGTQRVTLSVLLEDGECMEAVASRNIVVETLEGTTSSFMMAGKTLTFYLIGEGEQTETQVAELETEPFDAVIDTFETTGKANAEKAYLFYTDKEGNKVYRYDFEQRASELINDSTFEPEYIITDNKNNHVYWTSYDDTGEFPNTYIHRSNLDGTQSVKYWVSEFEATGLEIDVDNGTIYFSDNYNIRAIPTVYFDGVDVIFGDVIVGTNGGFTAIHFDEEKNRLFYVQNFGEHLISYVDLEIGEIYMVGYCYNPLPVEAIAVNNNENKVYWINQSEETVEWGTLDTFDSYEEAWILDVTNPRILEFAEH